MPFTSQLRIAVIAHLRHPISEPFQGGMEAHTATLVRSLIAAGHRPTLFAAAGSAADLLLEPITPEGYERSLPWATWRGTPELQAWLTTAYMRAWRAVSSGAFDIVHNNTVFAPLLGWAVRDGTPMVSTLHVPPFEPLSAAVAAASIPQHRSIVPSHDQQRIWRTATGVAPHVVPNGIDLRRWCFDPLGGARAIWFGRITATKGLAEALRVATLAGIGLDVAGPVEDAAYFGTLQPLWGQTHRYIGHLDSRALALAVGRAAVAVCTPLWEEPFGLVAAEALACGTPVAAFARGALPDVIGEAGALADDVAGLAAAIGRAIAVPRLRCRERAETMFGVDTMADGYVSAYRTVLACASSRDKIRAELA